MYSPWISGVVDKADYERNVAKAKRDIAKAELLIGRKKLAKRLGE